MPRVVEAAAAREMGRWQRRGRIATNPLAARLTRLGNRTEEWQQNRSFLIQISVVIRLALGFLLVAQFMKMKIVPEFAKSAIARIAEQSGPQGEPRFFRSTDLLQPFRQTGHRFGIVRR